MSASMLGLRMVSYVGHPLFTTEVVILFYITNYLYGRLFKNQKWPLVYMTVSFIDIALVGSKTGIVLIAAAIFIHNFQNKRMRYLFLALPALCILYATGVFDTVIARFIQGFQTGDLTSARSSSWDKLFASGIYSIEPWSGSWIMDSTQTTLVAALEYPVLRWAFLVGGVFASCLGIVAFLFPLLRAFRMKDINLLVCLGILIVDVNTFNTISTQRDAMFLYCWSVFLMLNSDGRSLKRLSVSTS